MRARLISEAVDFKRGRDSKDALGIGMFRNLFNEKPRLNDLAPGNFWHIYPFKEYQRLMKEYITNPKVQEFIGKHDINYISPEIRTTNTWDTDSGRIELVHLSFYNLKNPDFTFLRDSELEGYGTLFLAKTKNYSPSLIGPEKNRMYNNAGREWDKIHIPTDRKTIFRH